MSTTFYAVALPLAVLVLILLFSNYQQDKDIKSEDHVKPE